MNSRIAVTKNGIVNVPVLAMEVFDIMERRHWAAQHTAGKGSPEDSFGWYINGHDSETGPDGKIIALKTFGTLAECWLFMVECDKGRL